MMDEGRGVRVEGERLSVKEEGSGGELQVQIWILIRIRILQNDTDPLDPDPDPQHWSDYLKVSECKSLNTLYKSPNAKV